MTHPPTEDRREPDALEAAAEECADLSRNGWHRPDLFLSIMRRHGLRGPEPVRPDPLGEALNSGDGSYRP